MDEYTETNTSGRTKKWILQGGAAGGLILVGSVLLASFSSIGATPAEPAAESQACENAHQRPHCGSCILKLVEGDVLHQECLVPLSEGEILACQSKPTTDIKITIKD